MSATEYLVMAELQYHLMHIIKLSIGSKHGDYEAVSEIVNELRDEAGISRNDASIRAGFESMAGSITSALKGKFGDQNGEDIEKGIPPPRVIGDMVGKLFDNQKLLDKIGDSMSNLNETITNTDPSNAGAAMSNIFAQIGPVLGEAMIDFTKPPPGVVVTPESQRQSEEQAANFQESIKCMSESIQKLDLSAMMPTPSSSSSTTKKSSGSESESDSEGSDSESGSD
jgi:hypothetical protein